MSKISLALDIAFATTITVAGAMYYITNVRADNLIFYYSLVILIWSLFAGRSMIDR